MISELVSLVADSQMIIREFPLTGLRASVVRSASEFSALRPIWDDLVNSVQVSIYQTFEWQWM